MPSLRTPQILAPQSALRRPHAPGIPWEEGESGEWRGRQGPLPSCYPHIPSLLSPTPPSSSLPHLPCQALPLPLYPGLESRRTGFQLQERPPRGSGSCWNLELVPGVSPPSWPPLHRWTCLDSPCSLYCPRSWSLPGPGCPPPSRPGGLSPVPSPNQSGHRTHLYPTGPAVLSPLAPGPCPSPSCSYPPSPLCPAHLPPALFYLPVPTLGRCWSWA